MWVVLFAVFGWYMIGGMSGCGWFWVLVFFWSGVWGMGLDRLCYVEILGIFSFIEFEKKKLIWNG